MIDAVSVVPYKTALIVVAAVTSLAGLFQGDFDPLPRSIVVPGEDDRASGRGVSAAASEFSSVRRLSRLAGTS